MNNVDNVHNFPVFFVILLYKTAIFKENCFKFKRKSKVYSVVNLWTNLNRGELNPNRFAAL